MKIKFIITIMFFSLVGLSSCKKENTNIEPSDAVKEFFGLRKGTDELSTNPLDNNSNKFVAQINKKSLKDEPCNTTETLPNGGFIYTAYPCSGLEGYMSYSIDPETQIYRLAWDFCSTDPEVTQTCSYFVGEGGPLADNVLFSKREFRYRIEDKPEFINIADITYIQHELVEIEDNDPNTDYIIYNETYLSGTNFLNRGQISYNSDILEAVSKKVIQKEVTIVDGVKSLPYEILNVKGVEKISYNRDGVKGEFTINYGNGELDSKAIITEGGVTYEIDYLEYQSMVYFEMME